MESKAGKPRVIIVGSGFAGAAAANHLRDTHDVLVLEARNRTGGRTWTDHFSEGEFVDLGAAWVHGTTDDNPIVPVLKKFGIEWDDRYQPGRKTQSVVEAGGPVGGPPEPVQRVSLCDLACCRGVGLYNMGNALTAALDKYWKLGADKDVSFEKVLDEMTSDGLCCSFKGFAAYPERKRLFMRNLVEIVLTALTGSNPRVLGAHGFANDLKLPSAPKGGGNFLAVPKGGWQVLCDALLKGINIRLEAPVKAIRMRAEAQVEVELRSGEVLSAAACICTVPLGVLKARSIDFVPPLPEPKIAAMAKMHMGHVNRIAVKFDKNFWTSRMTPFMLRVPVTPGRTYAEGMTHLEFSTWVDWSHMVGTPILITFFYHDLAEKAEPQTDKELLDHFLTLACSMFPKEEVMAAKVLEHKITRWTQDEFSFGAYSSTGVGFSHADRQEVQRAHGRVHFAGEHTSLNGASSSVQGAYVSGVIAAQEVAAYTSS
jgi:monoamine oxidase